MAISVLHLDSQRTWRGGENQVRLLLSGLKGAGVAVHLAAGKDSQLAVRLGKLYPFVPLRGRNEFDLITAWRLARYCREHAIDIIHAHTSRDHMMGLLAKLFCPKLKLAVHRRVDYVPGRNPINSAKYRSQLVDHYIPISTVVRDILLALGIGAERMTIVRSVIEPEPFRQWSRREAQQWLRARLSVAENTPLIVNAAYLSEQKDHATLIEALRIMRDRGVHFHCAIAGEGELRAVIEDQIASANLTRYVTLLGFLRDEMPRFLAAGDVFVLSSIYEALGTVIMEAIYSGCCVVATRVGGIPEIVIDGETGMLVPARDPDSMAKRLMTVLGDPALASRLNAKAQEHLEREFAPASMVTGVLNVYKNFFD